MRTQLLIMSALVITACGGAEVATTVAPPPTSPEPPTTTTTTTITPNMFEIAVSNTAALDRYRFVWNIQVTPRGESAFGATAAGAVDETVDAMAWNLAVTGVPGAPVDGIDFSFVKIGTSYFTSGDPSAASASSEDSAADTYRRTTDTSDFPKAFSDESLHPAKAPAAIAAHLAINLHEGAVVSGQVDVATLDDAARASIGDVLDVELDGIEALDVEATIEDGHVTSVVITFTQTIEPADAVMELTLIPTDDVEFPDSASLDPEVGEWFERFIATFIAGRDEEARAALEEAGTADGGLFAVPDTTGLETTDAFCTIYGNLPYRWSTDAVVPAQLWLDHARAANETAPAAIAEAFALMLGHWEDRMDWQFTGGDRPLFTDELEQAERAVARWAVDACDLPQITGPEPERTGYNDFSCDFETRWIARAQEEYFAEFGTYADHLHILETHTEVFVAGDNLVIGSADNTGYDVVVIENGACDGP